MYLLMYIQSLRTLEVTNTQINNLFVTHCRVLFFVILFRYNSCLHITNINFNSIPKLRRRDDFEYSYHKFIFPKGDKCHSKVYIVKITTETLASKPSQYINMLTA